VVANASGSESTDADYQRQKIERTSRTRAPVAGDANAVQFRQKLFVVEQKVQRGLGTSRKNFSVAAQIGEKHYVAVVLR